MNTSKSVLEKNFPPAYREDVVSIICKYVEAKESCCLVGVKDNCKVNVLRFLASRPDVRKRYLGEKSENYRWVMVDVGEMCEFSIVGFYHLLGTSLIEALGGIRWKYLNDIFVDSPIILLKAIKEDLGETARKTGKTIVILFNNFDLIVKKMDLDLIYHHLVSIRQAARFEICYVFSGTRPFNKLSSIFNKIVWMTPFCDKDAVGVISRNEERYGIKLSNQQREEVMRLSGGHAGLIKFIIQNMAEGQGLGRSKDTDFQCERILSTLTDLEKAKLRHNQKNELLVNLGLQKVNDKRARCFSGILENYMKLNNKVTPVFCWDKENNEVYYLGKPLRRELTNKEFSILKLLLGKPGKTFSREEIMDKIWGEETFPSDWALDKQISRLREKIGKEYLGVVRGQGVALVV
jgi:hypothetical protein